MCHPDTFEIQLGDLPKRIVEGIFHELGHFTVPIVVERVPLGSGTLVKIDGHHGILTAEHVVRHPNPQKSHLRLDYNGYPERRFYTTVADFVHELFLPTYSLRIVTTTRTSDAYGPDLAFIALPPSPMLSQLIARKSFYDLTLDTNVRRDAALDNRGFMPFCGFPRKADERRGPSLGFSEGIGLRGITFITGPERYETRNNHDYYELGVERRLVEDIDHTFGGVSGGGVWRVQICRKAGQPSGAEYYTPPAFAGVAIYEEDNLSRGRFFVRVHGPRSIYDVFLPYVRATLNSP